MWWHAVILAFVIRPHMVGQPSKLAECECSVAIVMSLAKYPKLGIRGHVNRQYTIRRNNWYIIGSSQTYLKVVKRCHQGGKFAHAVREGFVLTYLVPRNFQTSIRGCSLNAALPSLYFA